jgi:hypothetical protein
VQEVENRRRTARRAEVRIITESGLCHPQRFTSAG